MADVVLTMAIQDAELAISKGKYNLAKAADAVMARVQEFWLSTDDDLRFRAACGALMKYANESDRARLTQEFQAIRVLTAALSGVPIEASAFPKLEKPLKLVERFQKAKQAREARFK